MLSLGERLKNARESRGWTQDQLADRINVTRYTISNWERDICEPSFDALQQLSELFSLDFLGECTKSVAVQKENCKKIPLNPLQQPVIEVYSEQNIRNLREITIDFRVTGSDQEGNPVEFRLYAPFSVENTDN